MTRATHERGAVALLTTMIFSVLILLLLLGMMSLMLSERRQQSDNQEAVSAYYAAESGVEDALRQLSMLTPRGSLPAALGNHCLNLTAPFAGAQVTCSYITRSGSPSGTLSAADQSIQVDSGRGYDTVVLSWDQSLGKPRSFYNYPVSCRTSGCPSPYSYAPPLEVSIAQYPAGAFAYTSGAVQLRNALFVPHYHGAGVAAFGTLRGNNPIDANCDETPSRIYHCQATISGLAANTNYIFRLRTKFSGTSYGMAFSRLGTPVAVPDGTYTIDVTARSGVSSRRVLYKVPYTKAALNGLDYVIYSDNDVCKDFSVYGGGARTATVCP